MLCKQSSLFSYEGVPAELQSTVETTTLQDECANHDELTEESSAVSSVPESSVSSPVAPTYSPILSMSSLTSTNTSSQDSGNHLQMSKVMRNRHTYKLIGDNIDKTVKPRDMRIGSQTQSLHYFHTYAHKNRIDVSHMEDQPSLPSLERIWTWLPYCRMSKITRQ